MRLVRRYERGASLVELLIALALGLASLSILASLVGFGIGSNAKLMQQSHLSEELISAMSYMAGDIRRAGFNGTTLEMVTDPATSPSSFANSISIGAYAGEAADSCIEYAYDADADGTLDNTTPNENYGFRLRDGAIEVRQGGALCTDEGWQDLTDASRVTVTALNFAEQTLVSGGVTSREITITMVGVLPSDTDISRRYQEIVLVRSYD
ncbi:hypothetical protein HMF8227_02214 [Saliniradius amylolyticus]|uniref:Type IV pilus assembly protein PilW n=1 Tax=Saliniradius amylolyticus TaxID=2183582 RepID=A0A2S2E6R6_9ALTE|nr:hypothetical protein [Saliniradius amylolyticus]AWL12667.1 hypothetical protein HMF8227_02214 [Saliniradius amylolyticus]